MRHTIAYENALGVGEQFILEGAIKFPEEPVPVTEGFTYHLTPVGMATDFQRSEDGEVTAEIDGDLTRFIGYAVGASFSGYPAELERNDGVLVVTEVTLRQVALTSQVPWGLNNLGLKTISGR